MTTTKIGSSTSPNASSAVAVSPVSPEQTPYAASSSSVPPPNNYRCNHHHRPNNYNPRRRSHRPATHSFFRQYNAKLPMAVTALRQECLPVLLLATEQAHAVAQKNDLTLAELLQGFAKSSNSSSDVLPPFRSVTRALTLSWDDLVVQFVGVEEEDEMQQTQQQQSSSQTAAQTLQQAALLQPADGNLAQELELLEDQVDNLLPSYDDDDDEEDNTDNDRRTVATTTTVIITVTTTAARTIP